MVIMVPFAPSWTETIVPSTGPEPESRLPGTHCPRVQTLPPLQSLSASHWGFLKHLPLLQTFPPLQSSSAKHCGVSVFFFLHCPRIHSSFFFLQSLFRRHSGSSSGSHWFVFSLHICAGGQGPPHGEETHCAVATSQMNPVRHLPPQGSLIALT